MAMEEQAPRSLAERQERLLKMELSFGQSACKVQSELQGMRELFKGLEEEQAAWRREREAMEGELAEMRAEVERLRAAEMDRGGSEEIDLKAMWFESRQALAPITPEAVRARTPVACGKENARSKSEDIQHLRQENERLKEKNRKLTMDNKRFVTQYNTMMWKEKPGSKAGGFNPDELQAAMDSLDKPPKTRRRSSVGGEGGISSPNSSADTNAPSTPLPPQTVAAIVTAPTASTPRFKLKAEPVDLKPPQAASSRENTTGGSDAALDDGFSTPLASSRKRSLESLGKQPVKSPAFKFVEPVRKKAERENLQATECKLCKKFYDAVIEGDAKGMAAARCNHMEKSRHRFRNLPPETPAGFWNIGFDSDF